MKMAKKIISLVVAGIMLMGIDVNVYAAEQLLISNTYVPSENNDTDILGMLGTELQSGEKIVIGDYSIEYQEETVYLNSNARATTTECVKTTSYMIYNNGNVEEWYRVIQTTNYTYDGKTAKINTSSCSLIVNTYNKECSHKVNINTVNNSSSIAPTYTIGLTMKLSAQSINIEDVVTVFANGAYCTTHYE